MMTERCHFGGSGLQKAVELHGIPVAAGTDGRGIAATGGSRVRVGLQRTVQ